MFRPIHSNSICLLAISAALLCVAPGLAQQQSPPLVDTPAVPALDTPQSSQAVINYWDPRQVLQRGGYVLWPIILCSIVSITFGLERFIKLRRRRVIPRPFVRDFFKRLGDGELTRTTAMELCRAHSSPVALVLLAAVRHWGRSSLEIEQAVREAGNVQIGLLQRNLRALQGSANIATLLGLLGTVVGMIQAFNEVAQSHGLGKAEVLANGIAQALLTTAAGLLVAIPSLFLYNYFTGRVERLVYEMDELSTYVIDEISAESLGTTPQPATRPIAPDRPKVKPKYVS